MSNRLFQGVVHQMRDTIGRVIGVIDENSTIVACSELSRIGTNSDFFTIELGDSHDVFIRDGYTYKPFGVHVKPDYAPPMPHIRPVIPPGRSSRAADAIRASPPSAAAASRIGFSFFMSLPPRTEISPQWSSRNIWRSCGPAAARPRQRTSPACCRSRRPSPPCRGRSGTARTRSPH